MSAAGDAGTTRTCARSGCDETFEPRRRNQIYHDGPCAIMASNRRRGTAGASEERQRRLQQLDSLLVSKGIDLEELEQANVKRVTFWQTMHKDADAKAVVTDLAGIEFSPSWETGPAWPVVQPGPVVTVRPVTLNKAKAYSGLPTAVVLPDMQIGYFRDAKGLLQATHDEAAIAIALAITRDAKPAQVVNVGDNLDLPEFGRYRLTPAFQQTSQATIDRGALLVAEERAAAPEADLVWLAGNHEERLPHYLLDNARAAFGLRRGSTPEDWPVLSVPYLCRFEDHGMRYVPGYPASHHWITQRLRVVHGDHVRSNNSTAHAYLASEKTSVIYGHIHRREWAERTREDHDGPRTVMAASPGCLCRIDGAVPSTKGGTDLDGRPMQRIEDWQQGLGVVTYDPDTGWFAYEQVAIHDGRAMWRGKLYGTQVAA